MTVAAVIVAGGSGQRAGGEKPKQYQLIGGKPVIWWTLKAFLNHPAIAHVQAVIGADHVDLFKQATHDLPPLQFAIGGSTRQESCHIGLEACEKQQPNKVLIHDAARPFVSAKLIDDIIAALDFSPAIVPGIPVADTMKFAPDGLISKTVDRASLWFVQTPQGFNFPNIMAAHRHVKAHNISTLTDDAAVAEAHNIAVRIVSGDAANTKITSSQDIKIADYDMTLKMFQSHPDIRTGQGIDFHMFETGTEITLCGVTIAHTQKLKGHSDADVALHALTDAILGSIGEGDIGVHFPPSETQWKNAASSIFVKKAMALLQARGGIIANVDITILAEQPKISPHISAMKNLLGGLLGISHNRIAIKATTTETMGAIGRKEGMAAFATATVRLPL
jgi:2-C-methyl-D-erythritol 4-phosphate cytidylyltransferase / 2-C-methyl-D-erythritol 2,4-cyclodiphosphate synthase